MLVDSDCSHSVFSPSGQPPALHAAMSVCTPEPLVIPLSAVTQEIEPQVTIPRINSTGRELRFLVPLADGEIYLGDIELAVASDDGLAVDGARLVDLLRDRLDPALIAKIAAGYDVNGRLSALNLAAAGVALSYDPERLALTVTLPADKRLRNTLGYGPANDDAFAVTLDPAPLSGFLNVFSSAGHVQAGGARFIAPAAQLDGAIRFGGVVLEGAGSVSAQSGDRHWRRTGTRLVYDAPAQAMRWTLGDTQIVPRYFQASPAILGLGVGRLYAQLDPQREIRANGSQDLILANPAVVETFVNGRSVERRTLQPGNYSLGDFPLAQGSNAVRLRIEETGGRVRDIDFSVYSDQFLLARAVSEFSAYAGILARQGAAGPDYSRDWIGSGFVRRGISEQLTLGASMQVTGQVQQVGVEALAGTPIGLVGTESGSLPRYQRAHGFLSRHRLRPASGAYW